MSCNWIPTVQNNITNNINITENKATRSTARKKHQEQQRNANLSNKNWSSMQRETTKTDSYLGKMRHSWVEIIHHTGNTISFLLTLLKISSKISSNKLIAVWNYRIFNQGSIKFTYTKSSKYSINPQQAAASCTMYRQFLFRWLYEL